MFSIVLSTAQYRPTALITIRCDSDWDQDIFGEYTTGEWRFVLNDQQFASPLTFKFVLNRQYWMEGDNLTVMLNTGQSYVFTDAFVRFNTGALVRGSVRGGRIEDDAVIRKYVTPDWSDRYYDFIIVGSGIGGGVLADRLAELGTSVLLLESGSYLFPVHSGNVLQRHSLAGEARLSKSIWSLWSDWKIISHENQGQGSDFQGGQGFYLGGRSLFWGAYAPRLESWEFERWPGCVRDDLLQRWYRDAERKLKVFRPRSDYLQQVSSRFQARFGVDYEIDTMPLAIEYSPAEQQSIPAGIFSTADLLLESLLTDSANRVKTTINLNHHVTHLEIANRRVTGVIARDLIGHRDLSFRAEAVILAAGTIGSGRIALQSKITDPYDRIGRGITDHPIYFTHFALPPGSQFYMPGATAKLTLRHRSADPEQHRFLCIVDIGSEFSQARYRDPDILADYEHWKGENMLAEVVFQLYAPLNEGNRLMPADPSNPIWPLHMEHCPVSDQERQEIEALKRDVIEFLGGVRLGTQPFKDEPINSGGLGGVAHEVGALRMGDAGVVDEFHKFVAYDNLFACDLSVFPSSPSANPTLTLAALALRLGDHLKSRFR